MFVLSRLDFFIYIVWCSLKLMLSRIVFGGKRLVLISAENGNAVKMRNLLLKLKMNSVSGLQRANYAFFSDEFIKFGHIDGKDISFTAIKILNKIKVSEVEGILKYLASGMTEQTPCDQFSNLAELVFNARMGELYGFVFDPVDLDRLKLIKVLTRIIIRTDKIYECDPRECDNQYKVYRTNGGSRNVLWDPNNNNDGLCVCLVLRNRPFTFPLINLEQLYIVDRSVLFLPHEPANKFKSYRLRICNILGRGAEITLGLAKILMKSDHSSTNHANGWKYIVSLLVDPTMDDIDKVTLYGIKKYLLCDESIALIAITRFLSCSADVVRNYNGTYSAFGRGGHRYETIYDWKIDGDDFTCVGQAGIDHAEDDSLSTTSSRPQTPLPPIEPLHAHLMSLLLLTRIDKMLDSTFLHLSMHGQIQSPPHSSY